MSFDSTAFFRASGTVLLGLVLGDDIAATEPAADGLALLLRLVKQGVLKPTIGIEAPWTEVATIARQLIDRGFTVRPSCISRAEERHGPAAEFAIVNVRFIAAARMVATRAQLTLSYRQLPPERLGSQVFIHQLIRRLRIE